MADSVILEFFSSPEFVGLVEALVSGGWIQFIFPLLLIYGIVFAGLSQVRFFASRKGFRVIFSIIIAFFGVAFPIADSSSCSNSPLTNSINFVGINDGCTVGDFMAVLFPNVSIIAILIISVLIVLGLLGIDIEKYIYREGNATKGLNWWVIGPLLIFSLLLILVNFLGLYGLTDGDFDFLADISSGDIGVILILAIFIAGIAYLSRGVEDWEKEKKGLEKALAECRTELKGKG